LIVGKNKDNLEIDPIRWEQVTIRYGWNKSNENDFQD
jgi:hypothetical protein